VFGAISRMALSAVAAIGTIVIPRMEERGYDHSYATAGGSVLMRQSPLRGDWPR
jgi:TRAP-type C4-dicarboxylate transport system permease large subunit